VAGQPVPERRYRHPFDHLLGLGRNPLPGHRTAPSARIRDAQKSVTGATPTLSVDLLDPDLRQPSNWKANLAFEMELPWYGLVAGAEALYIKTKDGITYQNLNLGNATGTGTDGRQLFWNAAGGLLAACWNVGNNSVSTATGCTTTAKALSNLNYGNVLMATGTDKGESRAETVSLTYPMTRKGLGWSVAATHTYATEVSNLTSSTSSSNWSVPLGVQPERRRGCQLGLPGQEPHQQLGELRESLPRPATRPVSACSTKAAAASRTAGPSRTT
jgi:hypothetical protein